MATEKARGDDTGWEWEYILLGLDGEILSKAVTNEQVSQVFEHSRHEDQCLIRSLIPSFGDKSVGWFDTYYSGGSVRCPSCRGEWLVGDSALWQDDQPRTVPKNCPTCNEDWTGYTGRKCPTCKMPGPAPADSEYRGRANSRFRPSRCGCEIKCTCRDLRFEELLAHDEDRPAKGDQGSRKYDPGPFEDFSDTDYWNGVSDIPTTPSGVAMHQPDCACTACDPWWNEHSTNCDCAMCDRAADLKELKEQSE